MNPAYAPSAELDILQLLLHAHIVVQIVVVGLLLASVLTWSIIIEKYWLIARERRATARFEKLFWSGISVDEAEEEVEDWQPSAILVVFRAALKEWRLSTRGGKPVHLANFRERVQATMEVEAQRYLAQLQKRLLFLATVGASAPFIGLFGTVWGIMNSFTAIAASQETSLAVVAPGIAEALFATALGLVAAIPAVIFYNKYGNDIAGIGSRLEMFAREFWMTISREMDLKRQHDRPVEPVR